MNNHNISEYTEWLQDKNLSTNMIRLYLNVLDKYSAEYWSIEQLLASNQEYSLQTGTPLGSYYFIVIDLDDLWAKERTKLIE